MNGRQGYQKFRIESCAQGLTSFEILASTFVFSLISIVVISIFISTQMLWNDSVVHVRLQTETKQPMQAMIKELKEGGTSPPATVTISGDLRTITFDIPETVSATEITSWTEITYSFDPNTGQITRTVDAQNSVIGRQINNLSFSQSGNVIMINLDATRTTADGKNLSSALVSQATMRN